MANMNSARLDTASAASTLNVLAGIWLIISPFILAYSGLRVAMWDTLLVGIVILVFAWVRAASPALHVGLSWLNLLLGIWLIVSPFVLGYVANRPALWNDTGLGIIVAVLAIVSIVASSPARPAVR
jgi:hypothetical protein